MYQIKQKLKVKFICKKLFIFTTGELKKTSLKLYTYCNNSGMFTLLLLLDFYLVEDNF